MRHKIGFGLLASLAFFGPLSGQGIKVSGIGYTNRTAIRVPPGQITTLFVTGLKTVLPQPVNATTVPLPTSLAGISVTLNQTANPSIPVPLLAVQQISVIKEAYLLSHGWARVD